MQSKFLVALQLEVTHHFAERCAAGRTGRLEPPATVGATKTSEMHLINPHQTTAHGFYVATPQRCLTASLLPACCQGTKHSPFVSAFRLFATENRHPLLGLAA
jgi:hypothetical protein